MRVLMTDCFILVCDVVSVPASEFSVAKLLCVVEWDNFGSRTRATTDLSCCCLFGSDLLLLGWFVNSWRERFGLWSRNVVVLDWQKSVIVRRAELYKR